MPIYIGAWVPGPGDTTVVVSTSTLASFVEQGHREKAEVFSLGPPCPGGTLPGRLLVRSSLMEWLDDRAGKSNRASMWLSRRLKKGMPGIYRASCFVDAGPGMLRPAGLKAGGYFVDETVVRAYVGRKGRRISSTGRSTTVDRRASLVVLPWRLRGTVPYDTVGPESCQWPEE